MSSVSQPSMTSSLGRVPSRPSPPVVSGSSSGSTALPGNVLTTGAASSSATARTSSVAPSAPAPTNIATFVPELRTSATASMSGRIGRQSAGRTRAGVGHRGVGRCDVAVRICLGRRHLDVIGEREVSHGPMGEGVADGQIHHRRDLLGVGDHEVVAGDIRIEAVGVHFLLVGGAEHGRLLHPRQRQHGGMIELGVVEPVEQVDGARP